MQPPIELNIECVDSGQRVDIQGSISAKQIIHAINRSVTHEQSVEALQTALCAFNHNNTDLHSYEVDVGAVNALTLKLSYSLTHSHQDIDLVSSCLELVLGGCSADRRLKIWQELGPDLIPLIIQTKSIGVLRIFCKMDVAKGALIESSAQHLVNWLLSRDDESLESDILGCFKDLTFRTTDRNREILAHSTRGFQEALQKAGDTSSKSREYIAAIHWNMALAPKVAMSMGNDSTLVTVLKMYMADPSSAKIRRRTISALGNIALNAKNLDSLVIIRDEQIWEFLQQIALEDKDADCRRRAMRTIRCMVHIHPRPHLLDFFTRVASGDSDRDTRMQAIECMAHLKKFKDSSEPLTKSLIHTIHESPDWKMTIAAFRLFPPHCEQIIATEATFGFWQRIETATRSDVDFRRDVCTMLQSISLSTERSRLVNEPVLNTIALLISESTTTSCTMNTKANPTTSTITPPPPPTPPTTATTAASSQSQEQSQEQEQQSQEQQLQQSSTVSMSLDIVEELASVPSNKRTLAKNDALLEGIANFAMIASEQEKGKAKALLLQLVPEL